MKSRILSLCTIWILWYSTTIWAVPFGTFDARSVAMGGTGVASATAASAAYYNPALFAQYKVRKEQAANSRFMFPVINATATNNINELSNFIDDDFDSQINTAVENFNNSPQEGAQELLDVTVDLRNSLNTVSSEPVYGDLNLGLVLGIAGREEGGSLLINGRLVIDGKLNFSEDDKALLDRYIAEAAYKAGGGLGQGDPGLYENGQLINPSDDLNSDAAATGVRMFEFAMAMGKSVKIANTKIAFGITPKLVRVTTYDSVGSAGTQVSNDYVENKNNFSFNVDIGVAHMAANRWTTGLVLKNVVPYDYNTELNNSVKFRPQLRAGVQYDAMHWGVYAMDLDLLENDSVGVGDATQMLGMGGEWGFRTIKFRAGMSKNFSATGANGDILFSAGIHASPGGVIMDFTYAGSGSQTSAAFQFGARF